ncbi:MFS transporter [Streptomyces carpinensis]|uniref:MFS transporter n=1 Tax=Streptomyces carpinensis TaxID=66369 RepID=A0ABV1VUQ3_9ACTN|nr:MFS transporter [Streptomyces carpinensis]
MARKPAPQASPDTPTDTARRRLVGGSIGTLVEWFDFLVYSLSTPVLARLFFPEVDPVASLLATLAVFGVAFFMRPLGGVLFGYLGDRWGRIRVLSITILIMGGATSLIGLLPTYAGVGVAAPVLLVVCRMLQGLSAGGEHSGALTYVLESAPDGRRGRWIGVVFAWSFLPNAIMGGIVLGLRGIFGEEAYQEWAWRLPFLLGGVLAGVGLWLRRRLSDPELFVEAAAKREQAAPRANPLKTVLTQSPGSVVRVVLMSAPQLITAWMIIGFMYTYMVTIVGMEAGPALVSNAIAALTITLATPFSGALADRIGRKPVMFVGLVWSIVSSYPAMVLVGRGTFTQALMGQLLLGMGVILFCPGSLVTMLELFRTSVRYSGHALSYAAGAAIFGGTSPLLAGVLVTRIGPTAPAFYIIAAAVLGLAVVSLTPETARIQLRDKEAEHSSASETPQDLAVAPAREERH